MRVRAHSALWKAKEPSLKEQEESDNELPQFQSKIMKKAS